MERITKWLKWCSRQPLPDNRAADAASLIEAHNNEVGALRGMIRLRDAELQRCYSAINEAHTLLRDIHADLNQTAKRRGYPKDWNSSEIRAVTLDKLTTLYGQLGKGSDDGR